MIENGVIMKKRKKKILAGICFLLTLLGIMAIASVIFVNNSYNEPTFEQIIFQITSPMDGMSASYVFQVLLNCLFLPLAIVVCLSVVSGILIKRKIWKKPFRFLGIPLAALIVFIGGFWYAIDRLGIVEYFRYQSEESYLIEENFVDPNSIALTFPEKKKNLIYIYLESMETTYQSKEEGGIFDFNCIPELTNLAKENVSFSTTDGVGGYLPCYGAGWTIASMFCQSSGLPFLTPVDANAMSLYERFMPAVTSIGEILETQGYQNVFMSGSIARFGGTDNWFSQHGDYEICDYEWAVAEGKIPDDYYVFWGFEDAKLFEFAKEKLLQMAKGDQPFNLTMTTIDTHFEDGYVCELCENEFGKNQYANVMACSSRQLAEFVKWVQDQEFGDDTMIVLIGDHLTMDSNFCDDTPEGYVRCAYDVFINPSVSPVQEKNRACTTLDFMATTLGGLGVEIEGNRVGLGTNLFSEEETLLEKLGGDLGAMDAEFAKKSSFYQDRFLYSME